jgi:hypothetical protein
MPGTSPKGKFLRSPINARDMTNTEDNRHPKIIEDEKAVEVVLRLEESTPKKDEQGGGGRRLTVTAVGSRLSWVPTRNSRGSVVTAEITRPSMCHTNSRDSRRNTSVYQPRPRTDSEISGDPFATRHNSRASRRTTSVYQPRPRVDSEVSGDPFADLARTETLDFADERH